MTVQSTTRKAGPFDGNGVTTAFPFDFKVFQQTDIRVVLTDSLGVETDGVLNSNYSVSLNADQDADPGGTVTYPDVVGVVLPTGSKLTIVGAMPQNQLTDITNVGRFNPDVVERAFDKNTILVQQLQEQVSRSVLVPVSSDTDPEDLIAELIGSTAEAVTAAATATSQAAAALASANDADADADAAAASEAAAALSAANAAGAAAAQVNIFKADLASLADIAKGTALVGFKPNYLGAVSRTLNDRLQDHVNAADFGLLPTNTGAQNVTAWGLIMAFTAVTPCTVQINRGTYDFNAAITFNSSNTRITGEGVDSTILRCTFAAGDFITQSGTRYYQTIDNLTLTSSVTRTSGAMFKSGFWKRGLMYRVKIEKHFNGVNLPEFEQCTIAETNIVSPTGAGTSLIAGTPSASNTGANLNILNCLLRGNDETIPGSAAVGLRGYDIYDVQAIFSINTDLSTYLSHACMIAPQTQAANFYFLETYFDATVNGHNVYMGGAGEKISIQFTSCWFAGAGASPPTAPNCNGLALDNFGTYRDILVSAGRFITTSAAGIYVGTPHMALNVTGSNFVNCGFDAGSTNRDSVFVGPAAVASKTLNITGNLFDGANGFDVRLGSANATGRVNLSGNAFNAGLGWPDGTLWGNVGGNTDPSKSPIGVSVASASTIQVPPVYNYVTISGTTNINRIQPTYPGHQLSMRFLAALTVVDDGNNIRLAGNYVTTGNSVLTLVCEANGDWREVARVTS